MAPGRENCGAVMVVILVSEPSRLGRRTATNEGAGQTAVRVAVLQHPPRVGVVSPPQVPPQPTLTDGVVVLRPWEERDVDPARLAHDEDIAHWFGFPSVVPSFDAQAAAVDRWRKAYDDDRSTVNFVVEHEGHPAGTVEVRVLDAGRGEVSWAVYREHRGRGLALRAVRLLVRYAFDDLGLARVEARVEPGNLRSLRLASRAGLRREGLLRGREDLRGERQDFVLLARLALDGEPSRGEGFRAVLNAGLPRKRAIAQLLVRDPDDRVLLCELTYKDDWDLPGGVVEVGESPAEAVTREVSEELALTLPAERLLVVDWMPPWSGWDDALCLVFDAGVHDQGIVESIVPEQREIRSAQFCTVGQARERCRDFTARRITAALAAAQREAGADFLHSGVVHPPSGSTA